MKKQLKIPKFKNKDEERDFWTSIDLSDYFQPSDFQKVSFKKVLVINANYGLPHAESVFST